jgi:hypothetical protein
VFSHEDVRRAVRKSGHRQLTGGVLLLKKEETWVINEVASEGFCFCKK